MVLNNCRKSLALTTLLVISSASSSQAEVSLEQRKKELTAEVEKQVGICKCLVGLIDRQEGLFPTTKKAEIPSREDYFSYIAHMKINAGKAQTKTKKIIMDWPSSKNSPTDLKALDVQVSEELRALSSFCTQPFKAIAQHVITLSKGKVKIDPQKCGASVNLDPPKKSGFSGFFKNLFKK